MPDTEAKDVLSRGGAAFNAVREAILGSSMKPEGKFLLDEITKQDIEITDLRSQLTAALEAQQKAEQRLASAREDLRVEISTRETAQCERDEARATIQRLEAENREMREDNEAAYMRGFADGTTGMKNAIDIAMKGNAETGSGG